MSTEAAHIEVRGNSSLERLERDYLNHEKGFWSWIMSIDHKRIGLMYLVSIIVFFVIGGLFALLIRLNLWNSGSVTGGLNQAKLLTNDQFNTVFTSHGIVMIFLFIVPGIPATLGNFILPLMLGAKDVAFPKLNRFSFWLFCIGATLGVVGLFMRPDTGWTFYTPYSVAGDALNRANGSAVLWVTFAAFMLGFSSILTGLNFIVTIHKLRCPGMKWDRLPLFAWSMYATSVLQVVATPVIGITLLMLIVENVFGIGVFDSKKGGDPVLFQHLFWFYSHPVVYIMILPAFGIMSEIIPVFSRKPIFGYKAVAWASIAIAGISFLVWGHHMFVAGMSNEARYMFSFLTFLVAIPTAIKVFNWVTTMYKGSVVFNTPMLYAMGFVFLFMIAGTTGIHLASLGTDAHYHDTYFVVAHFHYTIQGGAVVGLYAGLHFWFPKMFGRMYSERLAKIAFLLLFIGFNGTFLPQFALGMEGMPRRYADYPAEFQSLHRISTVFSMINALGYSLALFNLFYSAKWGKLCGANPWQSLGLEWQTPPVPAHDNFERIPVVTDWSYGYGEDDDSANPRAQTREEHQTYV